MATQPRFDDAAFMWIKPDEFVDCDVNGEIVQLPVADLECTTGGHDTENEWCSWIEYRRPGDEVPVHRSVRLHLKTGVFADGAVASFA